MLISENQLSRDDVLHDALWPSILADAEIAHAWQMTPTDPVTPAETPPAPTRIDAVAVGIDRWSPLRTGKHDTTMRGKTSVKHSSYRRSDQSVVCAHRRHFKNDVDEIDFGEGDLKVTIPIWNAGAFDVVDVLAVIETAVGQRQQCLNSGGNGTDRERVEKRKESESVR
ncbi:hypothetical protein Q1695_003622 [Nippostrongylus brasiliensis]|nr:hypothetical protein Q1695_003622 [Nippostrongylus brasiliensis]